MTRRMWWGWSALLALVALSLSCASSEQLTRRSTRLLMQGDARKAYDTAVDALERDSKNDAARGALGAAGTALIDQARTRFYNVIPEDTLAGARIALDVDQVRATLARWNAPAPADSAFVRDLRRARNGAADGIARVADDSLRAHRPRAAYRLLEQATHFAPERRDLDARQRRAFEQAVERVAVLPLNDQIGQPALSREVADRLAAALRREVADRELEFTRLVEPSRVYGRMTVAQLGDLSRGEAIRLGRDVGADVVAWGRVYDGGSDTHTDRFREPLWHRVFERGPDGEKVERWVQVSFETIVRERVYHLRWDLRLIATEDENTLVERSEPREVHVRTVWTNFRPEDDPANYALIAPEARIAEPDRARQVDKQWSATAGQWTVPKLLERAKASNAPSRATYRHEYRGEFEHADPGLPVFLGDLPGNDDLAWLALRDVDSDFLAMVKELDQR